MLRGRQELTLEQARAVAQRAGIPLHLLRFGGGGKEAAAKRRDFGKAAALALVAWPVLAHDGDDSSSSLTAITAAQRRLDAQMPARELARSVVAHVEMAHRLAGQPGRGRAQDLAALSEAAGLAGWLHADMCDRGSAQAYYRLAVRAARRAGHDLLAAYMLGTLAWFEISNGDPVAGLDLAGRAGAQAGQVAHPTPRAWLAATQALGHAAASDSAAADAVLGRAAAAVDSPGALTAPPWPWIYPFDHAKLAGYRALVCVRLGRAEQALAAFAESLQAGQPAPKQRAMVMLEAATAARQDAVNRHDTARLDQSFTLASDALAAGERYGSERVIERSRRFRRGYTGPLTAQVRQFDHQLAATLS